MQKYPEPIVGVFIINSKGELFLTKSRRWTDHFVVPGGHIELGEKIEDALRREVREETGLKIENPIFICMWEFINESGFWEKKHMLFLNYLAKATSEKVTLNDEAQSYVWVTPREAVRLPLEKYTKLTLEEYILKKPLVKRYTRPTT
ncbi:hypothetical protein A3H83_00515 [Candidatus Roizmanbacteria bacterium RIFCSPLOWO2_02_FULL_39_8]|uniref:Nudix hydrolase domain-containing protein n=1 Tax=Candidatus Daviesbacteria bacterium RIFCSPHIGHO2_12_FULL_43_11 TaxID=1797780 RepID=A0A1F5K380_9BACT|nr:MAG: hypothetical protein A3E45_00065 [Candidatus Daviesbacteria bacterium RIFCSPHIGHO2_12_FULL_43_11]OGK56872.1 MAG: hypothetical protein A3H83_00515 [Candidatus Roizmanbacteria bacterium RIFCSPLOWO2_02_FULL_39_8]